MSLKFVFYIKFYGICFLLIFQRHGCNDSNKISIVASGMYLCKIPSEKSSHFVEAFKKDTFLDLAPLLSNSNSEQDPKDGILSALWAKDINAFREYVKADGNDFSYVYKELNDLRIIDLSAGKSEYLEALINAGVNTNDVNPCTKKSAIHYAAEAVNPRSVKLLLEAGADVNAQDNNNDTALHILARKWTQEWEDLKCSLQLLLDWPNINVDIANCDGCTPFMIALSSADKNFIDLFLEKCSNIDLDTFKRFDDSKNGREILSSEFPEQYDHLPTWTMTPEKGAFNYVYRLNYYLRAKLENRFCQVLGEALSKGHTSVINFMDGQNLTYLQLACQNGLKKAVKLLLKHNVNVNHAWHGTSTPIFLATQNGHDDILAILLNMPDIQLSSDDQNFEGLLHAVLKLNKQTPGHYQCFRRLLKSSKIDPNSKDSEGRTCLHYAVKYGNDACLYELLDAGARLDSTSLSGESPLSLISAATLKKYLDSKICTNDQHPKTNQFAMVLKYQFAASENSSDHVYGISSELLLSLSNSKELRCLLKHPIYATAIFLKWQRICMVFYLDLFFYTLFCIFLTGYILFGHSVNECIANDALNICGYNQHYAQVSKLVILVYLLIFGITEGISFFLSPLQYTKNFENLLEIAVVIVTTVAVSTDCALSNPDQESTFCPSITGLAILLAWFNFFFLIGKHPRLTTFLDMFKTASGHLFQLLMVHTSLILAFALSFHMLFRGVEGYFSTVPRSIMKVIVMFTGEFELNDVPFSSAPVVSHIIFATFIFLVAIVLINLMVGLAVSATRPIEDDAFLYRCRAQVPIIIYFENIFYNKSYVNKLFWKTFKCFKKEAATTSPNTDKYPTLLVYPNQGNRMEVKFVARELTKRKASCSELCPVIKKRLTAKIVEDTWCILNNKEDSKVTVCDGFGKLHLQLEEVKRNLDVELEAIKEGLITILQKLEETDFENAVDYRRKKVSHSDIGNKFKRHAKLVKNSFEKDS